MASNTEKPAYQSPPGTPPPAAANDAIRRNSDPALDPANQHTHEHLHHSSHAQPDSNVVYAHDGHSTVPTQSKLHQHDQPAHVRRASTEPDDVEKQKADISSGPPGYEGDKLGVVTHGDEASSTSQQPGRARRVYRKYRPFFHAFIVAFFTAWWIAGLVLFRETKNWVVPFLLWLVIALRFLTFYVKATYVSRPIVWVWQKTAVVVYDRLPARLRTPLGAVVTAGAMIIGAMASPEFADNTRDNRAVSLFGLAVTIFVFWATSKNRKLINWRTVIGGMLAQFIIALFVLRTQLGFDIFSWIAARCMDLLGFAKLGTAFLTDTETSLSFWFILNVIPAIIFFVAIVQVLYYIGFLQWFIGKAATFIFWMLQVSGAEAVVAAATPFIGQGESAMLVRPFIPHMTKAEIHQIMTCGFATISGSVLIAFISMGLNPNALVSSCVMSIPASLAMSKLRYPETEETLTAGRVVIPDDDEHKAENVIHAFANGAWLGIKIAGSIVTSLLCIIAFVGLVDGLLTWWGSYLSIEGLTLQLIFGYVLYPVAFLLGVPRNADLLRVSRLIAKKIIIVSAPPPPLRERGSRVRGISTDPFGAERVRRLRRRQHGRLRQHVHPLQPHRHLRALRLRQHQFPGYPDRYPVPAGPVPRRRRRQARHQRPHHRHHVDPHFRLRRRSRHL